MSWFRYLKQGLSREVPEDRLLGRRQQRGSREGGLDQVLRSARPEAGSTRTALGNLRPFLLRHWRQGVLGALLVLLGSLLSFPQPLLRRALIDDVILGDRLDRLAVVAGLLVGIKGLSMLASTMERFAFARFEQHVILDIQHDLLDRTLRFPKSFFDDEETGYLMSRLLSDVGGLRWFFSHTIVQILSQLVRLVGGAVFLFALEWRLALVGLVLLPGLMLCVRAFSRRVRTISLQSMEQRANVSRRIQESLSSVPLIKAFAAEQREVEQVMDDLQGASHVALEQTVVSSVASLAMGGFGEIVKFVVLIAGAYLVITTDWTLGSLIAFQSYVGYVYGPARYLAKVNLQLQTALAALDRVSALYSIVPEESGAGMVVDHLSGEVDFRAVSFAYDEAQPVLEEISFHLHPGEHVAIVGPSGVGKTTLISLILRFYQPTGGEIWLDGRPASEYELRSLRRRIGYVSQSTLLLTGTIRQNLCYGNPDAGEEQIIRAARTAGIHDFITGLPGGYDSPVGEHGVNLSEGQKQRLSIARALIKEPDILVLDEPTSALDSIVERSIFDALPDLVCEKTLFVVAHRLSTIQDSDRILLLNESRLVAVGTHQELLKGNAFYRSLVANQRIGV